MTTNQLSIQKRRRINFWPFIIIGSIAVIVAVGLFIFLNRPEPTPAETPSIAEEDSTIAEEADAASPAGVSDEEKFNEVDQYEGTNPNYSDSLTGSLTHAESDGTNLVIRVNIDQSLTTGNCHLELTSDGGSYAADAPIFGTGSIYSSCEGFDIPLTDLSASSAWIINLRLSSGDKTGTIIGEVRL